jgi:hypothetical protein
MGEDGCCWVQCNALDRVGVLQWERIYSFAQQG